MSNNTQQAKCLACNQGLLVYELDERMMLDLTYCNNEKCSRYKLVTLQEDV